MGDLAASAPFIDVPHTLSIEAILAVAATDPTQGLSTAEATSRRARWGANELSAPKSDPAWRRFAAQFHQLVVWILIVAALIAGATGDWLDTVAILAIVLINAALGFAQEERAERALESLQRMAVPTARARRDGEIRVLPAAELVPGDIVLLEAGDAVPADSRLVETFALTVQEATLTGESVPSEKDAQASSSISAAFADRANMVYLGTTVAAGKGLAVVVATGRMTELGKIAGMLAREKREPTPLQRRMTDLGRILVVVCLGIVALIAGLLLWRGLPLEEVLLPAVSLAVAAVPEGLPAVVTVALALGLQRLVRRNALVRKLPSVETLGSVTVICSDKTGTLTRNEMTVRELAVGDRRYEFSGTGYAPEGKIATKEDTVGAALDDDSDLDWALSIGRYCNNAQLVRTEETGRWSVVGDPTEGALIVAAMKGGPRTEVRSLRLEHEIPFDSSRKIMSTIHRRDDGTRVMFMKGAPEAVLALCTKVRIQRNDRPLTDDLRTAILRNNVEMAGRALRVLGLAYRDEPPAAEKNTPERELTFVALVGMIDPPREEVRAAVERCREAGIQPVMITGDHPATARAIAVELGILDERAPGVLTGVELDTIDDAGLERRVVSTSVYARVTAEHKLRVVHAWRRRKQIVAMTGDGVNDAPAVKAADIGIAMGITGTDVTKGVSDMVLTDDDFTSIVNAVEEGRGILDNIRKVIHYLLACNAGEVLLMLFAALVGIPVPLTALQILWINLITDGLPALALAVEAPEPDLMRRRPRATEAALISWKRGRLIFLHGLLIAVCALAAFQIAWHRLPGNIDVARLVTFCVTAFAQLFFALSCRSARLTWPQLGLFTNRPLLAALTVSALLQLVATAVIALRSDSLQALTDPYIWVPATLLALFPVTCFEVGKLVFGAKRRS
ncbi:MAG: cation-translocating P-type ATPase [Planctomycetia bacterium]|nr:cation-translocating P-type ATPase [Planctomycetia bacterium]